jgi:3-hydroxymyristoyl/3-hydroxydecanoyl-(acyl carrier protein) dehydratase
MTSGIMTAPWAVPQGCFVPIVPHRHPMFLVDQLEAIVAGATGRGFKRVSSGDTMLCAMGAELFVPHVLIVDAIGQVAIAMLAENGNEKVIWYLAAIEGVSFGARARPGDTIVLEATVLRIWRTTVRLSIRARIGDQTVVEGAIVLATG